MSDNIASLGYLAAGTLFRRVTEKLYVDGDRIYQQRQLTFKATWFSVYYLLGQASGPKTVGELASEIGFTHITVKNVTQELVAQGYATIGPHPTDKRAKHIVLTSAGRDLLPQLQQVWHPLAAALQQVLEAGHPDILNILARIERELLRQPLAARLGQPRPARPVRVVDYRPALKPSFYELAGHWLLGLLKGEVGPEDLFALHHPDQAYLQAGGFVFFALEAELVVGCVALRRVDEDTFEVTKLFVDPPARRRGIARQLVARCVSRCRENEARQLWLQTTPRMPEAQQLFQQLGFAEAPAPSHLAGPGHPQNALLLAL